MKKILIAAIAAALGVGAWAAYQGIAQPSGSLARLMPPDALLFLEAKDFGALLKEWSASPQKQAWLASDNREVFSRSRLFLRLQQAQGEFASAAGIPPDMAFLGDVAGGQSALGIYDIGELELLYVSRLPSARAMNSGLWQQRAKFETRSVAGRTFYVRTDPKSERVTAFALEDDYLILGTREDLVAGALSLLAGQKAASLRGQGWFVDALKAAKEAGELRMLVHLAEVTKTPQFRTYWAPQNITEMRQYESSVTDLFRSASEYREERTLLLKNATDTPGAQGEALVPELARLAPPEAGFYRVTASPSVDDTVALLEQKILSPQPGPAQSSRFAPIVLPGQQADVSQSNLDVRIDAPPSSTPVERAGDGELKALLNGANVQASLQLHRSEPARDGVFIRLRSTMVLRSADAWNETAVQRAVQRVVAPGLTVATLGTGWKQAGSGAQSYWELDGLVRVALATRGKYLFVSDDPESLAAALGRMGQPSPDGPTSPKNREMWGTPALYYAWFDHARERENFYRLTALIDFPSRMSQTGEERQPEFFSQNVASVSKALGAVKTQAVVARREGGVERQTVIYEWAR